VVALLIPLSNTGDGRAAHGNKSISYSTVQYREQFHCLKVQVVTNRSDVALHVGAGVPGAKHDFKLFQGSLRDVEALITDHAGEPTAILEDKG
jgi:hypothetical protein